MIRIALFSLLTAFFATSLSAHEGHSTPAPVSPEAQHQATPMPDRIVLTWSADPAYTQDVTWRTSVSVTQAFVEYAVETGGPDFTANRASLHASTELFESDLGSYHLHSAKLAGLTPETRYVYRVGDGTNWSEWLQFKTASKSAKPFSFIYFGDAQNDIRSMWSRVIRKAHFDAPGAAFMLHAGDLINDADSDAQWGEWFQGGGWLNGMIPSVATPGNHEYREEVGLDGQEKKVGVARHWRPMFAFPLNGPPGLEETVYFFDYQGVRIISLNSNEQWEVQTEWLKKTLQNNPHAWTIVTFHHPLYSSARGRDNAQIRALWKPLFDQYRVDLVLQGHDHSYARTGQQVPDNVSVGANVAAGVNLKEGPTVYVVSVSGPKQYAVENRNFFVKSTTGKQLFQIIHVDQQKIVYEARQADGELYDSFELHKRPGQFNELRETLTESAEKTYSQEP